MKPILLHYYVTTRCNARCRFCAVGNGPALPDAALPDVRTNLAAARQAGCRFVDFTGGEPLLNRDLPGFLSEAKRRRYITSVTTNCLLFPDRAGELAGLIDLLHLSVSADSPELHDRLRGAASYDSMLRSIDASLKNRLVPDLLFSYSDENINAFEGIYRLARDRKLVVILDPLFDLSGTDPVSRETHQKARVYARRPGVYLNHALLTLRRRGGNKISAPLCRAVESTMVILPDNSLALPCFHHRLSAVPLQNDPAAVFSGRERSQAISMQGRYPFCKGCHLNCYFDPSFAFMRNILLAQSIAAKAKYAWTKYIIYRRSAPAMFFKMP